MADQPAKKPAGNTKPRRTGLTEAERADIVELFENVYVENRKKILTTNFLRGIFFGLGTFLGGTIVVALVVRFLTKTVDLFPWARDFTERLINSLQK
jgi:hypothetical protein